MAVCQLPAQAGRPVEPTLTGEGKSNNELGTLNELVALPLGTAAHGQNRQSSAGSSHELAYLGAIREGAQELTMTEERKHEQKPWYPTIERMPKLYNVENWQNRSVEDNPVLLEGEEAEENEPVTSDAVVRETVGSVAPPASNKPAKE